MTNVLLAIDGPIYGKAIAEFVANHRWVSGTNFKLIHAIDPPRGMAAWPEAKFARSETDEAKNLLDDVAATLEKSLPNMNVLVDVRNGFPKEEILTEAIEWPADIIVIGSHGRNGLQRFLLGSVSLSVIMQAPCSVFIVRLPNKRHEEVADARHLVDAGTR